MLLQCYKRGMCWRWQSASTTYPEGSGLMGSIDQRGVFCSVVHQRVSPALLFVECCAPWHLCQSACVTIVAAAASLLCALRIMWHMHRLDSCYMCAEFSVRMLHTLFYFAATNSQGMKHCS